MRPLFLLVALAIALSPAVALASPNYPGTIAARLDMPCQPACTLCHTEPAGGFGTVNTPFGLTVRMDYGLTCCDPASLVDVLDRSGDDADSDGDGSTDVLELQLLTDPNDDEEDADLACTAPEGDSGCSVRSPGAARAVSALFVAAVFVVVATAIRRGRLA